MSNAVQLYDKQGEDIGFRLTKSEAVTPRLTIVQPTSAIAKDVGQGLFYLSITGETFKYFNAVIFTNGLGRILLNPDLKAEKKLICATGNRIEPSARIENPKSKSCIDCKWNSRSYKEPYETDPRKTYRCLETITIIGMMCDSFVPFMFSSRSSSNFPIASMLQGLKFKCAASKKLPYQFPVTFSLANGTSEGGSYYVPKCVLPSVAIDGEEFKEYYNIFKDFNFDRGMDDSEERGEGAAKKPADIIPEDDVIA